MTRYRLGSWGGSSSPTPASDHDTDKDRTRTDDEVYIVGSSTVVFSCDVTEESVDLLMRRCREVIHEPDADRLSVHFNSLGGDLNAAFRFLDFHDTEIVPRIREPRSVVHGIAASAASLMAAVFGWRFITRRSTIMIHELHAVNYGMVTHMRGFSEYLETCMRDMVDVYAKATSLEREMIEDMLLRETWMTAERAQEIGLAEIIGGPPRP